LLVFCLYATAQQRDTLHGHISVADASAPGIFVINKNTGAEVKTDAKGLFKIAAKNGERLVVYSDKTVVREFLIGPGWFANSPYDIVVEPQGYEIEEVVVGEILAPEAFGLPKNQKRYTVAERRLKTATDFNLHIIPPLGVSFSLDPFINAITGRTKMLKKEMAGERGGVVFKKISGVYTPDELTRLGIPPEKANGFLYFAAEDATLNNVLSETDERIRLELAVIANKYLLLQQEPTAEIKAPAQNIITNED